MHTGQRDMIRIRVCMAALRLVSAPPLGEVLYAKIKCEFDRVVDKCQIKILPAREVPTEALRQEANPYFQHA